MPTTTAAAVPHTGPLAPVYAAPCARLRCRHQQHHATRLYLEGCVVHPFSSPPPARAAGHPSPRPVAHCAHARAVRPCDRATVGLSIVQGRAPGPAPRTDPWPWGTGAPSRVCPRPAAPVRASWSHGVLPRVTVGVPPLCLPRGPRTGAPTAPPRPCRVDAGHSARYGGPVRRPWIERSGGLWSAVPAASTAPGAALSPRELSSPLPPLL